MENILHKPKRFVSYSVSAFVLSGIYVLILITLYFFLNSEPITFKSLINYHLTNPFLFLIEIAPFVVWFGMNIFLDKISENVEEIERELRIVQKRREAIYQFVEHLRQGRSDVSFSNDLARDKLMEALIKLRDEINRSREEEELRKKEDQQRHWVSEGLAKFSAILRENLEDLQKLAEEITSNLTRYLDAKQAAFFLIKEEGEEKYLEMTAFFAYDRKKFPDKKLLWGEGLIGAAAIEKKTIVLNETTENFVEITSGLGSANPKAIIIAPLKDDDGEVHGVLELASFHKFEEYQVNFIEQVAQSIADTIANIKINLRTQELLRESQKQAEMLAQQEERMRRSMEELKITQQEAAKQSEEFISFTNSVNRALIRAEFTKEGFLIFANDNFLNLLGYKDYIEVANKHVTQFLDESDRAFFDNHWNEFLEKSTVFDGDLRFVTRDDQQRWFSVSFIGIKGNDDEVFKVLLLGLDRTAEKNLHYEYVTQIEVINSAILRVEFSPEGKLINANNNFLSTTGYSLDKIKDSDYMELLSVNEAEDFDLFWRNILSGRMFNSVTKIQDANGNDLWLEVYHTAIIINKKPVKVVVFGFNITERIVLKQQVKELHNEIDGLNKRLEEQKKALENEMNKLKKVLEDNKKNRILLEETFENMDKAVVSIDHTGHIVIFNKRAEELWSVKRDVVLGKRLGSILPALKEESIDDAEYLLTYFNSTMPLTDTYRLSYIVDKNAKRINVRIFIVKAQYEQESLITAFIEPMV